MNIVECIQGSPEWHAHRAKHFNASDAAQMLDISPHGSRQELVRRYALGLEIEVSPALQAVFDRGHEIEAAARPLVEAQLGADLCPVTIADTIDGVPMSASLDGVTLDGDRTWECKSRNADLWNALSRDEIPEAYRPQMEQGLMLSGASSCLFTVSDGTDNSLHIAYAPDLDLRARIIAGWKQFAQDVEAYRHDNPAPAQAVGAPVEGFGALVLSVEGRVVACNLDDFKRSANAFLGRLPDADSLKSDQDFADAEVAVKACAEAESRIAAAKSAGLAQMATVDDVFRAADQIAAAIRAARLTLEKAVKAQKETIRSHEIMRGKDAIAAHVRALNERLGRVLMPSLAVDFGAAIKGLRTVRSVRDAIDGAIATAKLDANCVADRIHVNLRAIDEIPDAYRSLFPDTAQIAHKAPDDLDALIQMRISQHNARIRAEQERMEAQAQMAAIEAAERERARIQAEEREKIRAEERARQFERDAAQSPHAAIEANPEPVEIASPTTLASPSPEPTTEPASMQLGEINRRLKFDVGSKFLESLGFPAACVGASKLYRPSDFPRICAAIADHCNKVAIELPFSGAKKC